MRNYEIEQIMYHKAIELIEQRYPNGWGGAARNRRPNVKILDLSGSRSAR